VSLDGASYGAVANRVFRRFRHAGAVQRNRILLLAAALGVAVVVVVVLIVVGTGGKSAATTTTTLRAEPTGQSSLEGVPQHGDTLGQASAPITITVFEDPQCPFCRQWSLDTLPTVVKRYVRPGRVKLVYRGIQIIGPDSLPGLRAIYAAGEQNKLWNVASELYRRQGAENTGWITDAVIRKAANAAGTNRHTLLKAMSAGGVSAALAQATREADFAGIGGTPTFLIERPPGLPQTLSVPALDPASFTAALDAALQ
jgi:protein-disulfide isomerase